LAKIGAQETHLSGRLAMLCGSTTFPTFDTLLADLSRHVLKMDFEKTPNLGRPTILWLDWAWALCHVIFLCHIVCHDVLFWT
jgi:hypothetical protein